ncbi:unnamed protein product [Symbiodinium pilosum]|uniref:Uncharacterized protein n=1 Tax=Symbiodinium pilosum TaxID=2952 RepID=A0A812NHP8_SYMPI|nr:unnamed protein product [Symbiodinium pilosum]
MSAAPQAYAPAAAAADLQRQMAAAAAQQGARVAADRARSGFFEVQAYISENPTSLKVLCFCAGLALVGFSLLAIFNPFDFSIVPKDRLCNIYNVFFGLVICICDGKGSWLRACGDLQGNLFRKAYFLASQTGRSLFYVYVGSMTFLLLPGGILSFFNRVTGGALCVLALLMLALDWCGHLCGRDRYNQMGEAQV